MGIQDCYRVGQDSPDMFPWPSTKAVDRLWNEGVRRSVTLAVIRWALVL